ncbi:GntR family transcriptional regulator [Propionibacteriaceae bacterium Y1700]|uniref:GntR family transcriptional regulator n=1 Tax=Microlunatus sp. Y1700 TaxID=3418487 RepID=UPI003DA7478C
MESLADRAYSGIKEEILSCAMEPGSLINEAALATTFGTSKTPVRQAIGRLAGEGFVDVFPRRGSLVRAVQVRDIKNVYLVRTLVEPEVSALAARSATADDIIHLQDLDDQLISTDGDTLDLRAHAEFHVSVCRIARVPQLTSIVSALQDQMRWFLAAQHADGGPMPPKTNHHRLLQAISDHDPEQARAITEESIRMSRARLLQRIIHTSGDPDQESISA